MGNGQCFNNNDWSNFMMWKTLARNSPNRPYIIIINVDTKFNKDLGGCAQCTLLSSINQTLFVVHFCFGFFDSVRHHSSHSDNNNKQVNWVYWKAIGIWRYATVLRAIKKNHIIPAMDEILYFIFILKTQHCRHRHHRWDIYSNAHINWITVLFLEILWEK